MQQPGRCVRGRNRAVWIAGAPCALALTALTGAAWADNPEPQITGQRNPYTVADQGLYIGAGYVRAQVNNVFGTTNYNFKIDDNAWKAILGFRFIPPFAVEANYADLGHQSQQLLGGQPVNGHADARTFDLYAVGLLPLGMVDLFGKAGGARWTLSGNLTGQNGSLVALDRSGTSFAWGAGAQIHYGPVGARLEYEHFHMPDTDGARLYTFALTFTF